MKLLISFFISFVLTFLTFGIFYFSMRSIYFSFDLTTLSNASKLALLGISAFCIAMFIWMLLSLMDSFYEELKGEKNELHKAE